MSTHEAKLSFQVTISQNEYPDLFQVLNAISNPKQRSRQLQKMASNNIDRIINPYPPQLRTTTETPNHVHTISQDASASTLAFPGNLNDLGFNY